jgi:hypothetical protein
MPEWRVNVFIQINTDNQVDSSGDHNAQLEEQVRQRLARFEGRITDVEIHVSDVNGTKAGGNLRCTLEARVNGFQPVAVARPGRDRRGQEGGSSARSPARQAERSLQALRRRLK